MTHTPPSSRADAGHVDAVLSQLRKELHTKLVPSNSTIHAHVDAITLMISINGRVLFGAVGLCLARSVV
jgi:hypothetical protein